MVLRESPFPNACVHGLHSAAWALIFPCFWSLDHMIAICVPTTPEKRLKQQQECYLWPVKTFFSFLLCLTLLVICMPLALIGFIVWAPLQTVRRPFSYSYVKKPVASAEKQWSGYGEGRGFSFLEANLCFLPNSLARFNNLARTQRRATQIATHICESVGRPRIKVCVDSPTSMTASSQSGRSSLTPVRDVPNSHSVNSTQGPGELLPVLNSLHYIDSSEESSEVENMSPSQINVHTSAVEASSPSETVEELTGDQPSQQPAPSPAFATWHSRPRKKQNRKEDLVAEISPLFPADIAFVCLLEVFEKRAAAKLKQLLQPAFAHVLYDVGVYGFRGCCEFKFLNSGIFFASRYPILHAEYYCFPRSRGEDALAAKGLLCVKIQHVFYPDWLHHDLLWNTNAQEWEKSTERVDTAQSITGKALPTIEHIYKECCRRKAASIVKDLITQTMLSSHCYIWAEGTGALGFTPTGSGAVIRLLNQHG
ncbi:sphingomyelin phosphodiesterase 5 isoform X2 [Hypanus sabinus]|uniref:sphingomyelin phosphodiesterase 5 isoform X2 n=1 Tax=Hypanus sabinus TaxID=79690 RepID=UPI0028C48668|nr:sphingomyelin phosphodiesterase 5 isoform X2 [Hypanus sabinus]